MIRTFNLPDFIIIGANKAGTTSVASYLNSHPKVKISDVKEPMFFTSLPERITTDREDATLEKPYFCTTLDEYSELFINRHKDAELFGEASTAYLANPNMSAKWIKKFLPEVKIIAILREPVSRAISAYKMCYGQGIETRAFSEIVKNAHNELKISDSHGVKEYIRNGLYSQLLKPYLDYFEKEQILLLNYQDLKDNPQKFMEKLFNFLNLETITIDFNEKFNTENDHITAPIEIKKEEKEALKEIFLNETNSLNKLFNFKF